jgi:dihydrofolate reductase
MRKIVYYVACSLDGFIMGMDEDMGKFVTEGTGVSQYISDLENFDTVFMGRKTYEFGYRFGLVEGQKPYPRMKHYIFSNKLILKNPSAGLHVNKLELETVTALKEEEGSNIYLCGGGELAGWLLENQQIDVLKLKLNPVIIGKGTRLFGNSEKAYKTDLINSKTYENGLQIMEYEMRYSEKSKMPQ